MGKRAAGSEQRPLVKRRKDEDFRLETSSSPSCLSDSDLAASSSLEDADLSAEGAAEDEEAEPLQQQLSQLQSDFQQVLQEGQSSCNADFLAQLHAFGNKLKTFGGALETYLTGPNCVSADSMPENSPISRGKRLDLSRHLIRAKDIQSIVTKIQEGAIASLELAGKISDENLEMLVTSLLMTDSLQKLKLVLGKCGPRVGALLQQLVKGSPSISSLSLTFEEESDSQHAFSADFPEAFAANKSLTSLNLSQSYLSRAFTVALSRVLRSHGSLTSLCLSSCRIHLEGLADVSELLEPGGQLKKLKLTMLYLPLGLADFSALTRTLTTNKTVTLLDLSYNDVGPGGAALLKEVLRSNDTLQTLKMDYAQIGTAGNALLAEGVEVNQVLSTLVLTDNSLGNEAVAAWILALQRNRSLTKLDLSNNDFDDEALEAALALALRKNRSPHLVLSLRLTARSEGELLIRCSTLGGNDVVTLELPLGTTLQLVGETVQAALGTQLNAERRHLSLVCPDGGLLSAKPQNSTLQELLAVEGPSDSSDP